MKSHTLILSTAKVYIPEDATIDFVKNLIDRDVVMVEYFGPEINNQVDFVDQDIKKKRAGISFFKFLFDTEVEIDYYSLNETEIHIKLHDLIKKSSNIEVIAQEKDIIIYL